MPENWKTYKLKEISRNVSRRFDFSKWSEVVFINTGDVLEGKFLHSDLTSSEKLPGQAKKAIKRGDILFSEIRPKNKRFAYVDFSCDNYVVSTKFMVIQTDDFLIDRRFFLQLLTSNERLNELQSIAEGRSGTFPQITFDAIGEIEFHLPPPQEQKSVASILSALDDKIELNNQMNKTLEEIALALYKHWFVDFGPFQDGEFVDSELGDIPKGWEVRSIYSLANFINGAAFKPKDLLENNVEGLPVIKIVEIKQGITAQTKYSNKKLDKKYTISNGDILFPWSGNPHTSLGIHIWDKGDALLNQHIFVVRIEDFTQKCFVFNLLKYQLPTFINLATHKQTTGLGHITVANLKELYIPYPNKEAIEKYNKEGLPIFDLIYNNQLENISLTQLRETLLPKLISGEVRVKDVEKTLSEVL